MRSRLGLLLMSLVLLAGVVSLEGAGKKKKKGKKQPKVKVPSGPNPFLSVEVPSKLVDAMLPINRLPGATKVAEMSAKDRDAGKKLLAPPKDKKASSKAKRNASRVYSAVAGATGDCSKGFDRIERKLDSLYKRLERAEGKTKERLEQDIAELEMERKGLTSVIQAYKKIEYQAWSATGVPPPDEKSKKDDKRNKKWQGRTMQAVMLTSSYRLLGKSPPPIKGAHLNVEGKEYDSTQDKAKHRIVVFCSAANDDSLRALSDMRALAKRDQAVSVVAVSVDQDEELLKKEMGRMKSTVVIHDAARRYEALYKVELLPQICVVKDGVVADVIIGYSSKVSRAVRDLLEDE